MAYQAIRRPDHTVEISATLTPEEVGSERREILAALQRRAVVPGFRRGRAPLHLVQARFKQELVDELQEHLSERVWHEVVEGEDGFEPISPLRVREAELADDGSFTLQGEVDVRPRFELPEPDGLSLPEVDVEVRDEEIAEELEKLRGEQAAWEPAEDAEAADGMLAEVDLAGEFVEGEGEPFSSENVRVELGDEGIFPEINESLQGARPGDERTATKRFPDDFQDPERAGRTVSYTITVKALKRKVLPELDDELAKGLGLETLDELRERIREVRARQKKVERRNTWRRSVLDQLEEKLDPGALPASLVRSAMRDEMESYAFQLAMRGVDPKSDEVDWQQVGSQMEPVARRKVLDTLVLSQLAERWEIAPPEHEVDAWISAEAARQGLPQAEHKANLAKQGKLEELRHSAQMAAVVDELIRRAGGEVE